MNSIQINARWASFQERLRNNYWLLPGVMLIAALALAFGTLAIDRELNETPFKQGWIYMGGADGARGLLASLAGATLTLAGVVFSMNLVSLTMASSQFGPRLLYKFVRDLGSQFTLGTFTAIFIYCMTVLREVKGEEGLVLDGFVPYLSVTLAGLMALGGIVVLIYYVHHVAVSIQAPVVVANVGRELESSIRQEFPHRLPRGQDRTDYAALIAERNLPDFSKNSVAINSTASGYVEAVDFNRLVVLAARYDIILRLVSRAGEFAIEGTPILLACPADNVSRRLHRELTDCIVLARRRNATQDIEFAVHELCEVAIRAMSAAINDPYTCINCIDWLAASVEELFQRDCPRGFLSDSEDKVRIIWHPVTHAGVMDAAFNQIRQFSKNSPAVMVRLLEAYARIAGHVRSTAERDIVLKHADMAIRACRTEFTEPNDIDDAEERYKVVIANLATGGEI